MRDISFPVFRLAEKPPIITDGRVYYCSEYSYKDTEDYVSNIRIVDDQSIDKPTLGLRRLALDPKTKFPISTAVYLLGDLVKLAKSTTWFIDSEGKVFQYKKSTRAKLQTYKIKKILPSNSMGCVVEVEGLVHRFKSMTLPASSHQYAGILSIGGQLILYGFYDHSIKPTWRMV